MKKLGKNIAILLGAMISALGIFYIIQNPDFFTASILSLQEITTIKEQGWDIAYKTDSGAIDIFVAEKVPQTHSINITIQYNPQTVTLDTNNMTGQSSIAILAQDEESITVEIATIEGFQTQESAILLPFQGEAHDILISESKAILPDGQQKDLSIGTLNQNTTHSQ